MTSSEGLHVILKAGFLLASQHFVLFANPLLLKSLVTNFRVFVLACLVLLGAPCRSQTAPDPLQRHNDAAQTFQLAGDLQGAETENRAVAGIALERLGNIRITAHRYPEAAELLQQSCAIYPSAECQFDLAIVRLYQGDSARGISEAQEGLKTDPQSARGHHVLGKLYFMQGDYKAAIAELEQSVVLKPNYDVGFTLGVAYLNVKDLTKARLLFDEMLTAMGNSPQAHALFGRAYRGAGFYDEALQEFKKTLELDPRAPRVHFLIGLTRLLQGAQSQFKEAGDDFEAELKITDDYFSHYFLGYIQLKNHDYPNAERHLQHASELRPGDNEPQIYLGQLYSETGRTELAEKTLRHAIALTTDPSRNVFQVNRAHYMLGRILVSSGRRDEGEKEIRTSKVLLDESLKESRDSLQAMVPAEETSRAATVQPTDDLIIGGAEAAPRLQQGTEEYAAAMATVLGNALYNLGVIFAQRQQFQPATDFFRQAAAWAPGIDNLQRSWGMAAFAAGNYAEAAAPLEQHLRRLPEDERPRQLLALSYFMQEKYQRVVETIGAMGDNLPADPALLSAYGESLIKVGDMARGERLFSRLLEENPRSAEIRLLLGQNYAQQDKFVPALEQYQQALRLNPSLLLVHYYQGQVLLRQGKPVEAGEEFRAELGLNPADSAAKYHLAYVLLQQQKKDEAVALLGEVIRDKPDYAEAHYELGKTLLEKGDVPAAIVHLEAAVRLQPAGAYNHYQLSIAYRRASRGADAEREVAAYRKLKDSARGTVGDPKQ